MERGVAFHRGLFLASSIFIWNSFREIYPESTGSVLVFIVKGLFRK
jgi:hypothetical protein